MGRKLPLRGCTMNARRILALCALLTCSFTPCFAHHIAVVVNKDNKVQNATSAQLAKIFRAETRKWSDGTDVLLVLHKASPDEMVTLERLNKMKESELKSFLASHKDSIRMEDSDADVIEAVASTPGAVGLVDVRSITNRVSVIKVDGKLPLEAGYLPH